MTAKMYFEAVLAQKEGDSWYNNSIKRSFP